MRTQEPAVEIVSRNAEQIAFRMPRFDPETLEKIRRFRSVAGFRSVYYRASDKAWIVARDQEETLFDWFPELNGGPAEPIVQAPPEDLLEPVATPEEEDLTAPVGDIEVAPYFSAKYGGHLLMRHQMAAIRIMLRGRFRVLADEMGLGKTRTAMVFAKILANEFGHEPVVVAPAYLLEVWRREARECGIPISAFSWAKFPREWKRPFVLLMDESHALGAGTAKRAKNAMALANQETCRAAISISGTPTRNGRPIELWSHLVCIRHPIAQRMKKPDYENRYCAAHLRKIHTRNGTVRSWDNKGISHEAELYQAISPWIIRRRKTELTDLPEKTRIMHDVMPDAKAQARFLSALREAKEGFERRRREKIAENPASAHSMTGEAVAAMTCIRRAASLAMVDEAIQFVRDLARPSVIFTEFRETARLIGDAFNTPPVMGGSATRQQAADQFQEGTLSHIVGTFGAMGTGLDLFRASDLVMIDRPFVPADVDQAESRIHRKGQRQSVTIWWIRGFRIHRHVDTILEEKMNVVASLTDGDRRNSVISAREMMRWTFELSEAEIV